MMKKSKIVMAGLVGLTMALTSCSGKGAQDVKKDEPFSCFMTDPNGNTIYGFEKESEDTWYLFVPSAQNLSNTVLQCTGEITAASGGMLDEKADTVSGAFAKNGDKVEITDGNGDVHTVAVLQSGLPSLQINLKDVDLETIHQDKDKKYAENTVILTDPDGQYNLTAERSVEIKGRGNTTWTLYDKKGYQIKFAEPTSVLGMGAAKKWVLLSNASDDSMMRSKLVYDMAKNMDMSFVPSFEYVDLWIEGEYRGTYMLGEKLDIGSSRLDLKHPAGTLFEHDENFYEEEDHWFYSTMLQRHFTVKEIVEEDEAIIRDSMKDFETSLDAFVSYLYGTPSRQVTLEKLSSMIDVDSFVKYYLINEYVLNQEAFATSFYWYKDGPKDVIHLGPIWDFDTCMGNDGADYMMTYGTNHQLFKYLLAVPEFKARTEELFAKYQKHFASMSSHADVLKEVLTASAGMNYLRWDVLGKPTVKEYAADFYPTFNDAVIALKEWLSGRKEHFMISDIVAVTSEISEDFKTMNVFFDDGEEHESVKFAVWNIDNEENMVLWSMGSRKDGLWQSSIDMTSFNAAGMYRIDAYIDEATVAEAIGYCHAAEAAERIYRIHAEVSEDRSTMTVTLKDLKPCKDPYFAVWSDVNGQDDLYWFQPIRNAEGILEYSIDMTTYPDGGAYCVHGYENVNGEFVLLDTLTMHIDPAETAE